MGRRRSRYASLGTRYMRYESYAGQSRNIGRGHRFR